MKILLLLTTMAVIALGYIEPNPTSIDELSASLLRAEDGIAVLSVYYTKPDLEDHEDFYNMFDE
jgi:hypothetical protein